MRYLNIKPAFEELCYVVIYSASFPLCKSDISESEKEKCSSIIVISIILLVVIELLFILADNLINLYYFIKSFFKKK